MKTSFIVDSIANGGIYKKSISIFLSIATLSISVGMYSTLSQKPLSKGL
jgi:hypothetical protein